MQNKNQETPFWKEPHFDAMKARFYKERGELGKDGLFEKWVQQAVALREQEQIQEALEAFEKLEALTEVLHLKFHHTYQFEYGVTLMENEEHHKALEALFIARRTAKTHQELHDSLERFIRCLKVLKMDSQSHRMELERMKSKFQIH